MTRAGKAIWRPACDPCFSSVRENLYLIESQGIPRTIWRNDRYSSRVEASTKAKHLKQVYTVPTERRHRLLQCCKGGRDLPSLLARGSRPGLLGAQRGFFQASSNRTVLVRKSDIQEISKLVRCEASKVTVDIEPIGRSCGKLPFICQAFYSEASFSAKRCEAYRDRGNLGFEQRRLVFELVLEICSQFYHIEVSKKLVLTKARVRIQGRTLNFNRSQSYWGTHGQLCKGSQKKCYITRQTQKKDI